VQALPSIALFPIEFSIRFICVPKLVSGPFLFLGVFVRIHLLTISFWRLGHLLFAGRSFAEQTFFVHKNSIVVFRSFRLEVDGLLLFSKLVRDGYLGWKE